MKKAFEPGDKKLLIDHQYHPGQQKLHQAHCNVISLHKRRNGPSPHMNTHREIHQNEKEENRPDQPFFQKLCVVIRQSILFCGNPCRVAFLPGIRSCFLYGGTVSCILNGLDDRFRGCRAFYAKRIGQKAHRTGGHSRNLANSLFHT